MVQANFAYSTAANYAGANDLAAPQSLAVFADRLHILAQLRDDAADAGFQVTSAQGMGALLGGEALPLAEVVLVDCPEASAVSLAALTRLDMRAAQAGAELIVSTTIDALDDVFGCLDQSGAQLLVDPGRVDFMLVLGRMRALAPQGRVRELAQEDRMALLRLTEQVGEIAARLSGIGMSSRIDTDPLRLESPAFAFRGAPMHEEQLLHRPRAALPDPRVVRRIIRQREQRARFFDSELFADPAWDMLLDLTAARAETKRVSVSSLCIAAGVPPTTALRWIGQMVSTGLFQRVEDMADRRRAFIELSDKAADAMARYFGGLEETPQRLS